MVGAIIFYYEHQKSQRGDGLVTVAASSGLPPTAPAADITYGVANPPVRPPIPAGTTSDDFRRGAAAAQQRDAAWANGTEADIAKALRTIPNLPAGAASTVVCGENICEVTGRLPEREQDRNLAMTYLNQEGFAKQLGKVNAMQDAVLISPSGDTFTIYLSRVRK